MAIPTHEEMLRPILALAESGDISRRSVPEPVADHFGLTPEERVSTIPSGATYIRNRAGWAMTFLTKAGLIQKTVPRHYGITDLGRAFLREHPTEITVKDLSAIPGWKESWEGEGTDEPPDEPAQSTTPQESIDRAITALNADLKSRLINAILGQSPTFFEQLVLDVLTRMGYGGSRKDAAERLGKSNDEGIDGRINQDQLGLDQIVVQAKRYARDHIIDRQTIQAFVGSMTGQGVTKGIFITTSAFNANAKEFVQRGAHTKIVLIDGAALVDLMLRHHIGVRVERNIELLDLDHNYFEEEE